MSSNFQAYLRSFLPPRGCHCENAVGTTNFSLSSTKNAFQSMSAPFQIHVQICLNSESSTDYGLSCLLPNQTITFSNLRDFVKMKKIFGNGSLDVLFGSAEKLMHLEWDDYCFDVEKEMLNPLLLSCQPAEAVGNKRASFLFVFYLSLVLWIVTFSLYLVRPDLRKRVHDKCFICCMGFGVLSLALAALRAEYGFRLRGKCWGP